MDAAIDAAPEDTQGATGGDVAAPPAPGLSSQDTAQDTAMSPSGTDEASLSAIAAALTAPEAALASSVYIDGTVHQGYPWAGSTYEGVWGGPFSFNMDDYPVTWGIAAIHAALLFRHTQMQFTPNTLMALALRASRLDCSLDTAVAFEEGCFALDKTDAWVQLQRIYPERFKNGYEISVGGDHFEAAAISSLYYALLLRETARLRIPDRMTATPAQTGDVVLALYPNGVFWPGLEALGTCAESVTTCLADDPVTADFVTAVRHYETALSAAEPYDTAVSLDDLLLYWDRIFPLYAPVEFRAVQESLETFFADKDDGSGTVSLRYDIPFVLADLAAILPEPPPPSEVADRLCVLYGSDLGAQCTQ